MPGAVIAIDQDRPSGSSFGSPGVARNDLWQNRRVRPRCSTTGNTSFSWTLEDIPPDSTALITPGTETSSACDFLPDAGVCGTYLLKLVTNGGGPGNVQILACAVTKDEDGVVQERGWRIPALGEQGNEENNFDGQTRGWDETLRNILDDIRSHLAGLGGVVTLGGDVTGSSDANVVESLTGDVTGQVTVNAGLLVWKKDTADFPLQTQAGQTTPNAAGMQMTYAAQDAEVAGTGGGGILCLSGGRSGATAPTKTGETRIWAEGGDIEVAKFGVVSFTAGMVVSDDSRNLSVAPPTERTPMSLALTQISKIDPFVVSGVGVQPPALITLNDNMSVTTLTRFTQLTDSGVASVTPTIASNLITFNMPVSQQTDNTLQEGAAITMPQFFVSIKVSSVTHSGADTNGGENVSVGICKSANPGDFIFALWRRKQGTFGAASIQVKIGGVQNLRGDITLSAAWVPPFDFGISCVANSITLWQKPNGGTWTKITNWSLTEIDLKTTDLTVWKPGFRITSGNTVQASFNLTDFKVGSFGAVSLRDLTVFSNEDGSPYIPSGDTVTMTATATDPQGLNYCGIFSFDLLTQALAQTGVIMVSRGGAIQPDTAAHVVYYSDTSAKLWISSWGNYGISAAAIQIYYASLAAGSPDLCAAGAYVIGMAQLTLPTTASGGVYDPYAVKIGSTWYLAYTIGPATADSYHAALASTADLSSYSAVGSDPLNLLFEGTRIVQLNGTYYLLAAGPLHINVYDLSMNYVGIMRSPLINTGTANAHPMLVVHDAFVYMITFDGTTVNGGGNWGQLRELRSPRYEVVFP